MKAVAFRKSIVVKVEVGGGIGSSNLSGSILKRFFGK
jgi:hypothetical protein